MGHQKRETEPLIKDSWGSVKARPVAKRRGKPKPNRRAQPKQKTVLSQARRLSGPQEAGVREMKVGKSRNWKSHANEDSAGTLRGGSGSRHKELTVLEIDKKPF